MRVSSRPTVTHAGAHRAAAADERVVADPVPGVLLDPHLALGRGGGGLDQPPAQRQGVVLDEEMPCSLA